MRRNLLVRARATLHRIEAEEAREVAKRIKWLADRAAFAKKYAVTRSTPRGRNWFRGSYGGGMPRESVHRILATAKRARDDARPPEIVNFLTRLVTEIAYPLRGCVDQAPEPEP